MELTYESLIDDGYCMGYAGSQLFNSNEARGDRKQRYLNAKLQRGANGLRIQFPERHVPQQPTKHCGFECGRMTS